MYLATAGDVVKLYNAEKYELHQKYKPQAYAKEKSIRDVGWSHDGKYFGIVVDGDNSIEIAHVEETMKPYEKFEVSDPSSIAFPRHECGTVAVGTKDGVVHTINYLKKRALITFPSYNTRITSVDYSPTGSSIAAGTVDGKIYICGIKSRQNVGTFKLLNPQVVSSVKFHHCRRGILAVGCHHGCVTIFDTNLGCVDSRYSEHTAQCTGVVFSPINKFLMASVGFDYAVFCYDTRSKSKVLKADIPAAGSSLDAHENGTTLAVSTVSGTISMFDLRNIRIPIKQIKTNGRIGKVMYQLEPEEAKKTTSSKERQSLERLIHKKNSESVLPRTPLGCLSELQMRVTVESPSSEEGSGMLDDVFSPISSQSPAPSVGLAVCMLTSISNTLEKRGEDYVAPSSPNKGMQRSLNDLEGAELSAPQKYDNEGGSEVEIDELLNKCSITNRMRNEFGSSVSMDLSTDISSRDKDTESLSKKVLPETFTPLEEEINNIAPDIESQEKDKSAALDLPNLLAELMSSQKEYIDLKFLEQSDMVYTNLSKMHIFNVLILSKHEIMLEKITELLMKEKVDKCVGKD